LIFRLPYAVPPGHVWFYQTSKGAYVESRSSFDDLLNRVIRQLSAEGSEIPANLSEVVQDFMCANLPESFCQGDPMGTHPRSWQPTYFSILDATTKMAKAANDAGGFGRQKMQDIERRAEACLACPKHSMRMCVTCNGLLAAFDHYRTGRKTPFDRSIRVCAACDGLLPVMIHMDAKYVKANEDLPDGCWVKKELDANG
jgi:hypothetical protein